MRLKRKVLACIVYANPSFSVGNNPYLTIFGFPNKLLQWSEPSTIINLRFYSGPWQGNIDDPAARPNASYTSNYQEDVDGNRTYSTLSRQPAGCLHFLH